MAILIYFIFIFVLRLRFGVFNICVNKVLGSIFPNARLHLSPFLCQMLHLAYSESRNTGVFAALFFVKNPLQNFVNKALWKIKKSGLLM